jgi:hypothetical protein
VEDGRLLKCGPPGTDNMNEPLEALWLKFKFVQFARKWVEGQRSMKRRRMNEASGMQVGALELEENVEQQSPQKIVREAPRSLITMPSVVRNCLFTIYIPTCLVYM